EASDGPSPSQPRLVPGSPDSRFCRKLSPVEIYYEMKARRNSVSSSA
ncbi:coiled-coil domain-containing protein 120, partial [Tachysurus ichikawai]